MNNVMETLTFFQERTRVKQFDVDERPVPSALEHGKPEDLWCLLAVSLDPGSRGGPTSRE